MKDELFEEDLENVVGGIPQEVGEEMAKNITYADGEKSALDELFETELEKVRAGVPLDDQNHYISRWKETL